MGKSFETNLDPSNKTFDELKTGKYPWWENLKKNEKISIQIRQGNTIDVYYNGGAILSQLRYDVSKKIFAAQIHPKYIPLENDARYQSLSLTQNGVEFPKQIKTMDFSQFEDEKLKAVMDRIEKYYGTESEKAIQFKFIAKDTFIIDAELQTEKHGRIDLVRLDESVKKIVLIEVKTMADPRLFVESGKGKENIHDQLKKYHEFAVDYQDNILVYYEKVLQIKNDLGLTKPDVKKLKINNWKVECKPLLVFGDCEKAWIKKYADDIDKKIKTVAYGAFYFREPIYTLDLNPKSKKGRHFFSNTLGSK
ncbi:MAG: DUF4263 domain-containing protein [Treponema sp.]|nr:DUF4263 domain-containing protein [Treponema sp.]